MDLNSWGRRRIRQEITLVSRRRHPKKIGLGVDFGDSLESVYTG